MSEIESECIAVVNYMRPKLWLCQSVHLYVYTVRTSNVWQFSNMYVVGACPGSRGVLNEQTLNNFNSAAASIIVPILYSAPFIAHYELKTSYIVQKINFWISEDVFGIQTHIKSSKVSQCKEVAWFVF